MSKKTSSAPGALEARSETPPWWRGASIYQIYPRSFLDSNGDGVGDLQGCIDGLDYVASLGVDAIWLSPFFTSPMKDFGYDVADFCSVDPLFGGLGDFDALLDKAHSLDLKVIIDQVYSHTSDQHQWFEESRQDRKNDKAEWYVWADPKPDGSPPNNWQSVFGGAAWSWDSRRQQYYFHNFLPSQPDLNLHNKAVQDALLEVAHFWLKRGVDGFRLDAINFAMHDPQLRDNPPAQIAGKNVRRTFDLQKHQYNQSHADIPKFLGRVRAVTDAYEGRFTVAEIGGVDTRGEMKFFTAGDQRLNTAYSLDFLYAATLSKSLIEKAVNNWADGVGWPSWAFSNHDAPRVVTRWSNGIDPQRYAKFAALLLSALRGNIFVYQGEELGLQQGEVSFERLQDPEAINNWPQTLGRDGARTPMPWRKSAPNAGFSTTEPWLPIDERHIPCAIDQQTGDEKSVLNFVRQVLQLRKSSKALRIGDLTFLPSPEGVIAFERLHETEKILCVFNVSEKAETFSPNKSDQWRKIIDANLAPNRESTDELPAILDVASGYLAASR